MLSWCILTDVSLTCASCGVVANLQMCAGKAESSDVDLPAMQLLCRQSTTAKIWRRGSLEASTSTCLERRSVSKRLCHILQELRKLMENPAQVIPADLEAFDPEYFSNLKWSHSQTLEMPALAFVHDSRPDHI